MLSFNSNTSAPEAQLTVESLPNPMYPKQTSLSFYEPAVGRERTVPAQSMNKRDLLVLPSSEGRRPLSPSPAVGWGPGSATPPSAACLGTVPERWARTAARTSTHPSRLPAEAAEPPRQRTKCPLRDQLHRRFPGHSSAPCTQAESPISTPKDRQTDSLGPGAGAVAAQLGGTGALRGFALRDALPESRQQRAREDRPRRAAPAGEDWALWGEVEGAAGVGAANPRMWGGRGGRQGSLQGSSPSCAG